MTDWTPETNEKPWCLLTAGERDAIEKSGPFVLRLCYNGIWRRIDIGSYAPGIVYRALPRPLTVKSKFWEAFPSINFVVRSACGYVAAFNSQPALSDANWAIDSDDKCFPIPDCTLIDPGTCDWREAIAKRPEGM